MNIWFGNSEEMSGVGELFGNQIFNVPFGMSVGRIGVVEKGKDYVTMLSNRELIDSAFNVAGERRDVLTFSEGEKISIGSDPYAQMALTRVCLLVGCMQTVLDLGVQFASERTQFGRSISKFQAIQHSLALVACEVAASRRAAEAAIDALGARRIVLEVAAAKARVGEAAGGIAEQVHQVHGAMGFTQEHRLHHYTKRLWSWRDEWGNEFEWQT